jgi:hypothetical protein
MVKSRLSSWSVSLNQHAYRRMFILFAGLQIADVITTNSALKVRGIWEANPIVAFAQAHLGEAWWLPKLVVVGTIFVIAPMTKRLWPMVFAVSYYVVIVCDNIVWTTL